ncbi:MAG: Hsp20/alpha crystallin family protein [Bacteroidales bacterium]|nr:Hsp20/alpha crystallin family protein [Bacteroidales bacterium]MCF8332601.1 Hsp20/alpha crystallin family protein [Bacteroidales bacterium]
MRLIRYGYTNPMEEMLRNFINHENLNEDNGEKNCYVPKSNIAEKDNQYEIEIAAPGLSKQDIKIGIEDDVLTVSSEKEEDSEVQYTLKEFGYGNFERAFSLPEDVDQENISASFEDGILTISLPKKEVEAAKKEIAIS